MRRFIVCALLVVLAVTAAACAPSANTAATADGAGFWQGLWHGFIMLFTFVISLFDHSVSVYEINNTGGWYDLGFVLGAMMFWGGGGGGAARSGRR